MLCCTRTQRKQHVYKVDTPVFPNRTQHASGKQIPPCLSGHRQGSCRSRTAPLEWWWRWSGCGPTGDLVPLWPLEGCMTQCKCIILQLPLAVQSFLAMQNSNPPVLILTGQHSVWHYDTHSNARKLLCMQSILSPSWWYSAWSLLCKTGLAPAQHVQYPKQMAISPLLTTLVMLCARPSKTVFHAKHQVTCKQMDGPL